MIPTRFTRWLPKRLPPGPNLDGAADGAETGRVRRVPAFKGLFRGLSGTLGGRVMGYLLILLLGINAVAIWAIVSARQSAEDSVLQDLRLQTVAQARTLEAVLASRRSDFVFLSQSPPLANALEALVSDNPMQRRWRLLDIQSSLLLFMSAHPEVERILLRDDQGRPFMLSARRDGAPVLLSAEDSGPGPEGGQHLRGLWPLGAAQLRRGTLEAFLSLPALLEMAAPGFQSRITLLPASDNPLDTRRGSDLTVSAQVRDEGWNPPVQWTMVRRENQSGLIDSIGQLAQRYRATVLLNFLIIILALLLGAVAFSQSRRNLALEAEKRQQAKIRELERQVQHGERLASLGRLAAGVAHEINNPLEGMANYLSLLDDDLKARRVEEAAQMAHRIRYGLNRAAAVVRQILAFAEPGETAMTVLDLPEVLRETVDFVQSNSAFRKVRVDLAEAPELSVKGDRVMLGQLFMNLLINACELQRDGGAVFIQTFQARGEAVVSVRDLGPGIAEQDLPRIFEPFFSTRGSTGLGLSVCHGIVKQHGGKIEAANVPGGGASFTVTLPIYRSA